MLVLLGRQRVEEAVLEQGVDPRLSLVWSSVRPGAPSAPVVVGLNRRELVRHLEEVDLARGLRLLPPAAPLGLRGARVHLVPGGQRGPSALSCLAIPLALAALVGALAGLAALVAARFAARRESGLPLGAVGPNVAQLAAFIAVLAAVIHLHGGRALAIPGLAIPGLASKA